MPIRNPYQNNQTGQNNQQGGGLQDLFRTQPMGGPEGPQGPMGIGQGIRQSIQGNPQIQQLAQGFSGGRAGNTPPAGNPSTGNPVAQAATGGTGFSGFGGNPFMQRAMQYLQRPQAQPGVTDVSGTMAGASGGPQPRPYPGPGGMNDPNQIDPAQFQGLLSAQSAREVPSPQPTQPLQIGRTASPNPGAGPPTVGTGVSGPLQSPGLVPAGSTGNFYQVPPGGVRRG